jgi:hypothetical protein
MSVLPKFLFEKEPPKVDVHGAFRNQRFPPPDDRIFLPIIAAAGGMSCLGRANTGESPVSYFKTCPLVNLKVPADRIVKTSHENLVNLQDAFREENRLIFTYDSWGISLQEILRVHSVFAFDESAVATICKEVRPVLEALPITHIADLTNLKQDFKRLKVPAQQDRNCAWESVVSHRRLDSRRSSQDWYKIT